LDLVGLVGLVGLHDHGVCGDPLCLEVQ
jgi:hypothetical protein